MNKTNKYSSNKIIGIALFTLLFIAVGIYIYQIFTHPTSTNLTLFLINVFLFISLFSYAFLFFKRWG